jgi:glycosyltransferase involved in cell wall biosynthesis
MLFAGNCLARGVYWWHHATAQRERPAWIAALVRTSEAIVVRSLKRKTVRILTGNSHTRAWLVQRGLSPDAITLTSNGPTFDDTHVSDNEILAAEPALKKLIGRRFVLFFARLTTLKGADDLPSIVRHVLESNDTIIVICGTEASQAQNVRRELESFEMRGLVQFMGFTTGSMKSWFFQRAHVLIAPSYEEGWGMTVGDGLAAGCWVVAYELPALREAFPDAPILVPLGDKKGFAEATVQCLEQPRPSRGTNLDLSQWERIAWADFRALIETRPIPA